MPLDLSKIKHNQNSKNNQRTKGTNGRTTFWKKELHFGKVINDKRKEEFYSELVILITSGLDLKAALDILAREQKNEQLRMVYESISDQILHGASFSVAIQNNRDFSAYEYYSLKIGEESGRLVEVMGELTAFFRKKLKQQKQLVSALSYPLLIFFTAFVAVGFMMAYIVPLFADAFKRFNSDLPALTKNIIALSDGFQQYWLILPVIIIILCFAYQSFKGKTWFRRNQSLLLLNIPLFGPLMRKVYLARFCQSMALMTSAHTPLTQALDLVSRMIRLYPFEVALCSIRDDLIHGKLFHESMSRFPVFESRMVAVIKVGEETNQLDTIFKRLYEQYAEETDHKTALFSSMLEPLLIVVVGGMVAVILISMYLPMFRLGNSLMGM
jgi:type IV pilus assembly protein PilC